MFWGLILEPGKRYSTVVDKSFHVSMATLDCTSVKKDNEILKVIIETENQENLLCNLSKEKGILQVKLDLNFMTGDNITFEVKGSGIVHLSGYLAIDDFEMEDDDEDGDENGEEEDGGEEESEESEIDSTTTKVSNLNSNKQIKAEKRKGEVPQPQQNKKKKNLAEEAGSDSDTDEFDEFEGIESEDEELNGSNEEDENEESDDEEVEEETPVTSQQQLTKQQKKQQTPDKLNKSKVMNGGSPNQPQSGKKDTMKVQSSHTPGGSEDGTPKKKVVEGGVVIRDVIVGNGAHAKTGKLVEVYYTGRLQSTNKIFESMNKGEGFKFRLGKGEVIKGWDIGVKGMKVGGKRVLICPPNAAYGAKGLRPTIPPNSTLIFEIELKASS